MTLRKVRAAFLLTFLLSVEGHALAASEIVFSDVAAGSWYANDVSQAVNAGIVSGYTDAYGRLTGAFGPMNPVTIGESLKIVLLGAGHDTSGGIGYGHWAAKYMSVALGLGFELTKLPSLNLDRPATRAEVASLLVDAFRIQRIPYSGSFQDVTSVTPYAEAVQTLQKAGIVQGDTDASGTLVGTFRPASAVNRAEILHMVMEARRSYGSSRSSSSSSRTSSSSTSTGSCKVPDCGPAPQIPNWQCPGGTLAGPVCERLPDGRCGWIIKQCPVSSSSSSVTSSSGVSQTFIVRYTGTGGGFQPSLLYVRVGDTVKFRNESTAQMSVASNPHPSHTDLPSFVQNGSVGKNGEYSFVFTKTGVFGYHNHMYPAQQAVIVVDPR